MAKSPRKFKSAPKQKATPASDPVLDVGEQAAVPETERFDLFGLQEELRRNFGERSTNPQMLAVNKPALHRLVRLVQEFQEKGHFGAGEFRQIAQTVSLLAINSLKSGEIQSGSLKYPDIESDFEETRLGLDPYYLIRPPDLEGNLGVSLDQFNRHLDAIAAGLEQSPEFHDALRTHDVFKKLAKQKDIDPVVTEILQEVTVSWDDRKKPEHKGQPWAKNASTYIAHFLAKWIASGKLHQAMLKEINERLYNSYTTLLSRNSKWDLGLPKGEHVREANPERAIARVREKAKIRHQKYLRKST